MASASEERPVFFPGYEVIRELGKGSFSDVYLVVARASPDSDPLALKRFRYPAASDAIDREIAALKIMSRYPYAPRLRNAVREGGDAYVLMDYIEGQSVYDSVRKNGAFDKREALRFLRDTLAALSHIHANNILHTDIKVSNVMQHRGRYCFIDFGLCRFNGSVATTTLTGGDRYLAPEVFRGRRCRASDIYALGCVLYYCLTQRFLHGLHKSDPLEKKIYAAMRWAPDLGVAKSRRLRYILARMLEKDPMRRATIVEIEAIMAGEEPVGPLGESSGEQHAPGTATETYRELAEDPVRIVYAQYRYAMLLEKEASTAQEEAEAIQWFRSAALAGYALAQHRLGFLYYRGRCGLPRDYNRARYWFAKAAEQRYHRAEYYMGRLYELGRGVARDKKGATVFYRRAIAGGDTAARERLADLC
jgi:predicted Ser/Thr protein kinase